MVDGEEIGTLSLGETTSMTGAPGVMPALARNGSVAASEACISCLDTNSNACTGPHKPHKTAITETARNFTA
jgi:hypothetical protein